MVLNRKGFLAATAGATTFSGAAAAAGVPGGTHRVERRADFDEALFARTVGRTASIRQVFEAVAFRPTLLGNIKNAFNGLQFGFGYPASAIAIALAGHGPSAAYAYDDSIWRQYRIGEFFALKDASGAALTSNVYLPAHAGFDPSADPDDPAGMYQDSSVSMLQRRGLIVLTCHTAVAEQSRALVAGGFAPGRSAAEVMGDILTHLVDGALVVPSMVAALAVLQNEYRFAYVTLS